MAEYTCFFFAIDDAFLSFVHSSDIISKTAA